MSVLNFLLSTINFFSLFVCSFRSIFNNSFLCIFLSLHLILLFFQRVNFFRLRSHFFLRSVNRIFCPFDCFRSCRSFLLFGLPKSLFGTSLCLTSCSFMFLSIFNNRNLSFNSLVSLFFDFFCLSNNFLSWSFAYDSSSVRNFNTFNLLDSSCRSNMLLGSF